MNVGFEFLGMPNTGKSELGRWLNGQKVNGLLLRYHGPRPQTSITDFSDRSAYFLESLVNIRKEMIRAQEPGSVLLIDRGFHDALLLYNLFLQWGSIKKIVVAKCREIIMELKWHQVPRILMRVPIQVTLERELKSSPVHDPYKRWRVLLGEPVEERIQSLYAAYEEIQQDEKTCFIDGTAEREFIRQQVLEFITRFS